MHTDSKQPVEVLREKIKGVRIAMLSTLSGEKIVTRPMSTQEMSADGKIWFITSASSNKIKEIEKQPAIGLAYSNTSSECYVSVAGEARVFRDQVLIDSFWNPFYKAWFESPQDPDIRIIEVTPLSAEYWDTAGGKIVSMISILASAVTGKQMEAGENKEIKIA